MTEKKLTEAEIMKALECCLKAKTMGDCEDMNCPAFTKCGCSYVLRTDEDFEGLVYCEMLKDALDLINGKNSECKECGIRTSECIEKLQKQIAEKNAEIERMRADRYLLKEDGQIELLPRMDLDKIRSEAIKEFAERVEETTWYHINAKGELVEGANSENNIPLYKAEDIYQIAKEMGAEL